MVIENRKNARFKYTVDRLGEAWVTEELNRRLGWEIEPAKDYEFDYNGDRLGWIEGENNWNYTLFIQNGRVKILKIINLKQHFVKLQRHILEISDCHLIKIWSLLTFLQKRKRHTTNYR